MTKLPSKLHPDYQDEFFLNLDRILVPIGGRRFECTGLELAFYIAHEYGSHLDLLHIGTDPGKNINGYLKKLAKFEVEHDLIVRKGKNIPKTIIDYWMDKKHNLVIMSGKRRPTIFDKITIPSISNAVIPHIETEVLQVFPPTMKKDSDKLKNIAVLLPYSYRDPFLLRWASAIAAPQKGAVVKVYHIARVPETVPLIGAAKEKVIKKEEKQFKEYVDEFSKVFGQIIQPRFILGHRVLSSLESIFEKDEPDLVIIGKTKETNFWQRIVVKSLSSKIRDKLLSPGICIHHMR
ncbi:MAG: universal stress protein [Candidatus Heimdallarchaeota archaeon]|nr:universal stress protein [Candidatus Heimdallarchaeota archaeon]